jgi:hypothetical protein
MGQNIDRCHRCNGGEFTQKPTTFQDGTQHIKRVCVSCGTFNGWVRQSNMSFRDECFFLVQDLANLEVESFSALKMRAKLIMAMVPRN